MHFIFELAADEVANLFPKDEPARNTALVQLGNEAAIALNNSQTLAKRINFGNATASLKPLMKHGEPVVGKFVLEIIVRGAQFNPSPYISQNKQDNALKAVRSAVEAFKATPSYMTPMQN